MEELRQRGIVTKVRHLSNGRTIGGIRFTRGSLAYLLRNRFYIGEVRYREICLAQHTAILDRDLFEGVQQTLSSQDLVTAAIHGRLPRGVGVTRLTDAPIEWSRQWHMLGL